MHRSQCFWKPCGVERHILCNRFDWTSFKHHSSIMPLASSPKGIILCCALYVSIIEFITKTIYVTVTVCAGRRRATNKFIYENDLEDSNTCSLYKGLLISISYSIKFLSRNWLIVHVCNPSPFSILDIQFQLISFKRTPIQMMKITWFLQML